jgi:hypothetical protein
VILVDASVWIDHFRHQSETLLDLLREERVLGHPFARGEVALGNLRDRRSTLLLLSELPAARVARDGDVLALIENHRLFGRGIGYVDAHLLASALLTPEALIWTRDRRLVDVARDLGIEADFG